MTSRCVIHGSKTQFEKQLKPGDDLIVEINGKEERRRITMVLGLKALSIDEPFSQDIVEKQKFRF